MAHAAAAGKIAKTHGSKRTIAITLSGFGAGKRPRPSRNWRHAMSTRTRTIIRRLLAAATLALPLAGRPARALVTLRPLRDLSAVDKKARALARKTRYLSEESAKALDGEIDAIGRRIRS